MIAVKTSKDIIHLFSSLVLQQRGYTRMEFNKGLYGRAWKGTEVTQKYVADHSLRLTPVQQKLIQTTEPLPGNRMLGNPESMQLLENLVKMIKAKKTLDIGTFTGYSSLTIAQALPADGKVVTMDVDEETVKIAKPFWKEAGVAHKIDSRIGPAVQILESLVANGEAGTYDFSFIDADKENYSNYYELSLKLLRQGGLIAIDNVLWSGKVVDTTDKDPRTVAIQAINDKVRDDMRVDISMLMVGDGTTLAIKK